ncbi:MAG: DNA primase, partial [Candidatus Aegiribacteria sp.]|nr:DNA primase [Candidatus Aegiribacteria sp.]
CGAGGDAFSFLMNYLNYSFTEAVEELADEAGIQLERSGRDRSRTDVFREILKETHRFYLRRLSSHSGAPAMEYLKSRRISVETVDKLGVGWAPEGNLLSSHLRDKGFSENHMIESGMVMKSRSGTGIYDRFRSRIVFPISDRRGRVISFGGRIFSRTKTDAPKYLNGPDSPIFRKGDYLYGYRSAASAARDLDMVIVVEGYFDHARFCQLGFDCVVATCGTALTPSQARQAGSLSSSIFLCYDGDSAGQRASVKAAEVVLRQGLMPRLIDIPRGEDPDDYLADKPGEEVLELTTEAADPIRYALNLLGGWSAVEGSSRRIKVVRRLTEIAASASEPVIRETLLKIVASETGYSMDTLLDEAGEFQNEVRRKLVDSVRSEGLNRWDSRILAALLLSEEGLSDTLVAFIREEDLRTEAGRRILREIKKQAESDAETFQLSLMDDVDRSLCAGLITRQPDGSQEAFSRDRIIWTVEKERLQKQRRELTTSLAFCGDSERQEILERIRTMDRKIVDMEKEHNPSDHRNTGSNE